MAWEIRLAHPLSVLADRWVDDWQGHLRRPETDPFDPVRVIVPNRNLKRWLQMHASRRGLVVANLRFQYLEEGIRSLLEDMDGRGGRGLLLRRAERQSRILHHLHEDLARDPDRGDRRYPSLIGSARTIGREQHLRLYQLSVRLASLFEDYEFHRPRSMEEWRDVAGPSLDRFGDSVFETETEQSAVFAEQRRLYREVMKELETGGRSDGSERGISRIPIAEYARQILSRDATGSVRSASSPVFLFGLSLLSRMHLSILAGLSAHCDLRLFVPDVSPHLFESVSVPVEDGWEEVAVRNTHADAAHSGDLAGNDVAGGVASWNRPLRDLVWLLHGVSDGSMRWFESAAPRLPARPPLLQWLHDRLRGVTDDTGPARMNGADEAVPHDGLSVLSCPGEWREIETVFQSMLQRMKDDPALRLTDMALLVPDMEHYRPYILHVFDRETGSDGRRLLPYNLSDYSADGESRYASGVRALMELIEGPFTRSRVFDLFFNPCFQARRRVERETVREWLSLVDDVRIHRFFDAGERATATGARAESAREDAFTWLRGLRRLYLGLVAGGGVVADMEPHPLLVADRTSLLQFIETIDDLHRAVLEVSGEGAGRERLGRLLKYIDEFLCAPPDQREEEKTARAFLDSMHSYDAGLFHEDVYLRESVFASLAGIDGGRGQYLAAGVTICSLQPMRPVPFRYVYVAGLGEGRFPAKEDRSSIDLLFRDRAHAERKSLPMGDSSLPEKARLLLMETLLAATDGIVLLFNGRDTSRDRELLPSAPLQELMSFLGIKNVEHVPLKLYSTSYLAAREASLEGWANFSSFDMLLSYLARSNMRRGMVESSSHPPDVRPASVLIGAEDEGGPIEVSLRELADFLRHPVETILKRRLGIYDSDLRDAAMEDDEPFHPEKWDAYRFDRDVEKEVLEGVFRNPDEDVRAICARVLADITNRFARRDRMPLPPYDRIQMLEWQQKGSLACFENAATLVRRFARRLPVVGVGSADRTMPGGDALELPLMVAGRERIVRLTGEVDFVCMDGPTAAESAQIGVVVLSSGKRGILSMISPVLLFLAMRCLSGAWQIGADAQALILVARDSDPLSSNVRSIKTEEIAVDLHDTDARSYLANLLTAYLTADMEYLPFQMLEEAGLTRGLLDDDDSGIDGKLRESIIERADRMDLMQIIEPVLSQHAASSLRQRWEPLLKMLNLTGSPRRTPRMISGEASDVRSVSRSSSRKRK